MKLKIVATVALMVASLLVAGQAKAQKKLTVWWAKGFYKSEDDALFAAVKKFEEKHKGIKIELSLVAAQEIIPKSVAALEANNPPDVAYGDVYDLQVTAKWAYEGKLEDVSSIIDPLRSSFEPQALSTSFLYNNVAEKRAYYAYPIKQQTMHILYWRDMLADAGFKDSDIPKDWKGYWDFWCNKVQDGYRRKTGSRAYGTGFPMGLDSSDSFYSFLTFMDAHNVKLMTASGRLNIDDPDVRQGLIETLKDYSSAYAAGCTPPSSTSWQDPDNDVAFHNKTVMMTHDAAISIAAKWLDDSNSAVLTAQQRAIAKNNYDELITTAGFPNKPDGSKMVYRASVKTGVIFKDARNKADAKEFVAFILDEANLTPYVEGSLGRWFPVTKKAQQSRFWKRDPHRLAVYNQFMNGTTLFEFTQNYRFTLLNNENVWARAVDRVVSEKVPVDKAVDELIARIKAVASQ